MPFGDLGGIGAAIQALITIIRAIFTGELTLRELLTLIEEA